MINKIFKYPKEALYTMKKGGFLALLLFIVILSFSAAALDDEDGDGYCVVPNPIECNDTYNSTVEEDTPLDCNDNNPMINPGVMEVPDDGLDNNCNGLIDETGLCIDSDGDGYYKVGTGTPAECGGEDLLDCDDSLATVNPGMEEDCNDDIDNDCDDDTDEDDADCAVGCTINAELTGWYCCDEVIVDSANAGDSVFLLLWTENCHDDSEITFKIYEQDDGGDALIDTLYATASNLHIPDEETGVPTDESIWATSWIAQYIEDTDNSNPEYFFEATLAEPGNRIHRIDSDLLTVTECPANNPYCAEECVYGGGGSGMPFTDISEGCPPPGLSIDCTSAPWGECNVLTNTMTRDVSDCTIAGADDECIEIVRSLLIDEQTCTPSKRPSSGPRTPVTGYCGDGECGEDEDEDSCPEDCEEGGMGWLIFIIIIVLAIGGGIAGYFVKKKLKPAEKKEVKKEEKMPFESKKDLDSVLNYIKTAKQKGMADEQIKALLAKGGWKEGQISYAFKNIAKPAAAAKSPFATQKDKDAVVEYIKVAKQRGMTEKQVSDALLKSGRSKEQVKSALEEVAKSK